MSSLNSRRRHWILYTVKEEKKKGMITHALFGGEYYALRA